MGQRTSYEPGTPSWVDIGVPDRDAAAAFYAAIFGWDLVDMGPDAGGYGMFQLNGLDVAGVGPQQMPGPPFWTVYMSVTDVDATAELVTANGGTIVAPPMDVFESGRMAVFQDPSGAFFSAWQPKAHIGAQLVNVPGSFGWNELAATDIEVARTFYPAVFGWTSQEPVGAPSATFALGDSVVCGAHTAGEGEFGAWSIWFSVTDVDATAAQVAELGGSVLMPPNDMDFGRGAVVSAPDGAVFGIAAVNPDELAD